SLSRIAEHAGISKSVISYHFAGKEELLLNLVEEVYERLGTAIVAAIGAESTPTAKLAAYIRSYLHHAAAHLPELIAAMDIVVSHRDAQGVPMYLTETE